MRLMIFVAALYERRNATPKGIAFRPPLLDKRFLTHPHYQCDPWSKTSSTCVLTHRPQRDRGFSWQNPSLWSGDCNRTCSAVARRVARPKHASSSSSARRRLSRRQYGRRAKRTSKHHHWRLQRRGWLLLALCQHHGQFQYCCWCWSA